jgi:prevent-host-death family protein
MDKTIGISDLRKSISAKVKEVHEDRSRYIIMQRSKAKAVLISPDEIETLEIMADKEILNEIKQAKSEILEKKLTNRKKRELNKAILKTINEYGDVLKLLGRE